MEEPDLNYWQPESLPPLPSTTNYDSYPDSMSSYPDTRFHESPFGLLPPDDTVPPQYATPTFPPYASVSSFAIPSSSAEYFSSSLTQNSEEFTPTQPLGSFAYPPFDLGNYSFEQVKLNQYMVESKLVFKIKKAWTSNSTSTLILSMILLTL